jgi:AcrR family transcriptional regulator
MMAQIGNNNESENARDRIVRSAWDLFYDKGFEQTTLNDILEAAGVSRGTFYYHFKSKNTLLNTLSILLDDKYRELEAELPEDMNAFDKLMELNYRIHDFIGNKIDCGLMANLYASQLLHQDTANMLDRNRYYYTMLTRIIETGQKRGEIIGDRSVESIVNYYSMCEHALITDWCMKNGAYSLGDFSRENMPRMFGSFRTEKRK